MAASLAQPPCGGECSGFEVLRPRDIKRDSLAGPGLLGCIFFANVLLLLKLHSVSTLGTQMNAPFISENSGSERVKDAQNSRAG